MFPLAEWETDCQALAETDILIVCRGDQPPGAWMAWTAGNRVPLVLLNSISFYDTDVNLARPFRRAQTCHAERVHKNRGSTMRVKRASRKKRTIKAAVTVVGAAGLGLSLFGSASRSTMPAADIPQSPNQRFVLGEEEMQDVSLATFHLFDRENVTLPVSLRSHDLVSVLAGDVLCLGCVIWRTWSLVLIFFFRILMRHLAQRRGLSFGYQRLAAS